ncbi:MAG: sulfatase [Planctomycetota bacterium]
MKTIALTLLLLFTGVGASAERPNILFLAFDDLRPEIGAYGAPEAITPNIDQLAAESTLFNNAFVNYPLCLPSRASLLTGIRFNNRNFTGGDKKELYPAMLAMQTTWPAVFRDAGYWTATRGKLYHGNVPKEQRPAWDVPGQFYIVPQPYRIEPELKEKIVVQGGIQKDLDAFFEGKAGPGAVIYLSIDCEDNKLHDGAMADEVIGFIESERDKSKPFLISAGFTLPHLPWIAPKKYFDMYPEDAGELAPVPEGTERIIKKHDQRPISSNLWNEGLTDAEARRLKRAYLATTTYADAQMGRIIDAIKKSGEYDNTIIVLWGDHGYHLSEHGLWQKNKQYRVNMRCPLIIKAPGMPAGQVTNRVVQNTDLYPTLLALAGVEQPDDVVLQGKDLSPLLQDPDMDWPHVAHVACWSRYGINTEQYRFTDFGSGEYELYDITQDPDEWNNLADDPEYAQVINTFKKQLDEVTWNKK